ncbi:uncharacterized protein [Elaeis guineensis]|uniref:uncharacterized protein isoform X2 n=1 Tax=Elaeis guineensis var. tenera TaxID=51953 RepID=UPI00057B0672
MTLLLPSPWGPTRCWGRFSPSPFVRSWGCWRRVTKRRTAAMSGGPTSTSLCGGRSRDGGCSSQTDTNLEMVAKMARDQFTKEISFRTDDKDISLAKALLLVAAEDEAVLTSNQDMDSHSLRNERNDATLPYKSHLECNVVDEISLAGKSMHGWLNELDIIAREVEAELISRDIGCHLMEIFEAVNTVLFGIRGFKRFPVLVDPKFSYMHTVLSSGCGSAIMISIIYIEVCRRLGVSIVGSRVGEDFLIWPETENPEELFRASSGHSLLAIINGRCVEDPRSKASDLDSKSLLGLDIASNRDIIGIALANMIRLHWKRASRLNHGLMLTSPLRPVYAVNEKASTMASSKSLLLRPLELRLATMAAERLLILKPDNWTLRRDHGMLLYYGRSCPGTQHLHGLCSCRGGRSSGAIC